MSRRGTVFFVLAGALPAWYLPVQAAGFATEAGHHEVGITATAYEYSEPSVMSLKATKLGIDYAGTRALSDHWFVRADARFATGKADYAGSGIKNDVPDRYYEVRGLIGKEYPVGGYTLSPYIGIGYRHLFNDLRGPTSTNNPGYRRESTYLALPIGIIHRSKMAGQAALLSTAEFDYLLRGEQKTKLSDIPNSQDFTNRQRHGYGLRLGVTYQTDQWSVGPFVHIWRIGASDVVSGLDRGVVQPKVEPENKTVEAGIRAAFRF